MYFYYCVIPKRTPEVGGDAKRLKMFSGDRDTFSPAGAD
jgi:hypothetical protein